MDYKKLTHELKHKERTLDDLISYIKTRTDDSVPNYSLLLGAGASYTSGIDTGENLVAKWRKEIYSKLSNSTSSYDDEEAKRYLIANESNWYSLTNEYSSLFEYKFDLPSQRRRFVEQEVDKKLPSIGYSYLVSLAKDRYFDTIYTTNFDDLLNEAFYQFSQVRPIVCAHDSSVSTISVTSKRPKIVKLHGDYLFDDIKSTLRETESLEVNIKEKLIQFSKEYGLIVIGYAGNDRSIMDVINYLLKSDSYLKNGIYWCIREKDKINPELTKLLWKDRVYFVKIDGFDEALAQIHNSLKSSFSLKENFTNSKKENIISAFTEDRFKLSNNSILIKSDIEELRKHKESLDISNLIRELNEKEFDGSEEDFKVLLKSDRLVSTKNYQEAISKLKNHIENLEPTRSQQIYLRKMIKVYDLWEKPDEAISLCDKLIELDPFNIKNFFLKASKFKNLTERCKYIKENIDKYNHRYDFHNYLFNIGSTEFDNVKSNPFFTLEVLDNHINTSIRLEPSIENPAYSFKLELIEKKFQDCNQKQENKKKEELDEHLSTMKAINDKHFQYIKLTLSKAFSNKEYSAAINAINNAMQISESSSNNKKEKLINVICNKFPTLVYLKDSHNYSSDWRNFLESDLIKDMKQDIASILMCKAKFQLSIERNASKAIELIHKARHCDDSHKQTDTILRYLLIVARDHDAATNFIEKNSKEYSSRYLKFLTSEVLSSEGKHEEAIAMLEESYSLGLELDDYVTRKSFYFLKAEQYSSAISLTDNYSSFLSQESSKDILIINRETANRNLSNPIDKIALRNVINRKSSEHIILAAECLLEQTVTAKRLINEAIEKDYYDYFAFQNWPVIPKDYLPDENLMCDDISSLTA